MSRPSTPLLAFLAVLLALAAAAPARAYDERDLRTRLSAEMQRAGARSGAVVRDLGSSREVYTRRPDGPRIPASVDKLFTTAATLLRLGPTATLDTVVVPSGPIGPDGVVQGDLVLVGAGDPFFGARPAARLVRAVKAAGITGATGGVVGDESRFDRRRSQKGTGYDFELGGVLSALSFDRGIARGRAQRGAATFAAGRFGALLAGAGVELGRRARTGVAPPGGVAVAASPSMPVGELIRFVNVPSNNFAAEMLLKVLGSRFGAGGSTRAGAAVAGETLGAFDVRPTILDGSGLSRGNLTTPREVVRLLERMNGPDVARAFTGSLAVTGRTGTVKRRLRGGFADGRCQVKTGTLTGVSALAGYCRARSGGRYAFAFMTNGLSLARAHGIQDRMTAALARVDEAEPEPLPDPAAPGGVLPGPAPAGR